MSNLFATASNFTDGSVSPPACWNGTSYVLVNPAATLTLIPNPGSGDTIAFIGSCVESLTSVQVAYTDSGSNFVVLLAADLTPTPTPYSVALPVGGTDYEVVIDSAEGPVDTATLTPSASPPVITPASPQVVLRWSDDGGHTWSNEQLASQGATGKTSQRVMWRRIGSTRRNTGLDRVFEVSSDDDNQVALVGASIGDG